MRLGNSSCSPKIGGLVLEHLCPAIQNILEDGLRDHKLDFIVGQRRNHSWGVVEVSTRIGKCIRVKRIQRKCHEYSGIPMEQLVCSKLFVDEVFLVSNRSIHQGPSQPGLQNQTISPTLQPMHETESLHHGPA